MVKVLSSFPEEDYHDIESEPAPHDISEFSHETKEEMQPQRKTCRLGRLLPLKVSFLFPHGYSYRIVDILTSAWIIFYRGTATAEGETFSNIAELIEELTQLEGTRVLKISTEVASISATFVAVESSQSGELPEDLPVSSTW